MAMDCNFEDLQTFAMKLGLDYKPSIRNSSNIIYQPEDSSCSFWTIFCFGPQLSEEVDNIEEDRKIPRKSSIAEMLNPLNNILSSFNRASLRHSLNKKLQEEHHFITNVELQQLATKTIETAKRYLALEGVEPLCLHWKPCLSTKSVQAVSAVFPNSPWKVVKSQFVVRASEKEVFQLLIDDKRSREYDSSLLGFEVIV
jgi:hypothetical protein